MTFAHITGWGMSVPESILTNDDLSQMVETNDKWIRERTGIRERRIAREDETTASLAVEASLRALQVANLHPTDVDLIICSTSTPEHIFPATACLVQDRIGAHKAGAFDLSAACSGFIYGEHGSAIHSKSLYSERSCDWLGNPFAICELERSEHLHPVRGWRGRLCFTGQ